MTVKLARLQVTPGTAAQTAPAGWLGTLHLRTVRGCGPDAGLRKRADRLSPVVFQAGLKASLCPPPASSGPVCPGIALLIAQGRASWPLPPPHALGDGAKPPENRQNLPVDALGPVWQNEAAMNESEKQFSLTRAALSTCGRAKSKFLSAKVKSCCSEGGSPSSLGREAPEFRTKEPDGKV